MRRRRTDRLHGLLVVDKPAGLTSAAVVAEVKRRVRAGRVGHTGTLDPMATGVLPLCLGQATKLAGYLLADDKEYAATATLGIETTTLDAQGEVTRRCDAGAVTMEQLAQTVSGFWGAQQQVPPQYSALRRGGKRCYERARAGETLVLEPRAVVIDRLEVTDFANPCFGFHIRCSKGTYVRAVARDIGRALGCGAHLSALRRTRAGAFSLADAVELAELTEETARAALVAPADAVPQFPAIRVRDRAMTGLRQGNRVAKDDLEFLGNECDSAEMCRLLSPTGELVALAIPAEGYWQPKRVFDYS